MPDREQKRKNNMLPNNMNDLLLLIDDNTHLNLNNICEYVLTIFDAKYCRILVKQSGTFSVVAQSHDINKISDQKLPFELPHNLHNTQIIPLADHAYVISPFQTTAELLITFHKDNQAVLTEKENTIIELVKRDIKTQLLSVNQYHNLDITQMKDSIINNNTDWILVKDSDSKIIYANDAFISLFPENQQDKVIGTISHQCILTQEACLFLTDDNVAFDDGYSVITEDINLLNSTSMAIETTKKRFEDSNGAVFTLSISRDITKQENRIRQLTKANNELGDFTSIASHDLKSPLNAIRRLLEWISEDCENILPQESLDNLRLVMSRANRMNTLLGDLLNYAQIGRQDSNLVKVSLKELLNNITPLLDIPKTYRLSIDDVTLIVPSIPFSTVMLNVISNAIKHNDKVNGEIDVTMEVHEDNYIINVVDNGPGIEAKYFDRVFLPFKTLKSKDQVEGSGLGLSAVVKQLNYYGGKVEIESDGKLGTRFIIYWPITK